MIYTEETPMPFGKHKGKKIKDIPKDYFVWLYGQGIQKGNLDLKLFLTNFLKPKADEQPAS